MVVPQIRTCEVQRQQEHTFPLARDPDGAVCTGVLNVYTSAAGAYEPIMKLDCTWINEINKIHYIHPLHHAITHTLSAVMNPFLTTFSNLRALTISVV